MQTVFWEACAKYGPPSPAGSTCKAWMCPGRSFPCLSLHACASAGRADHACMCLSRSALCLPLSRPRTGWAC